MPTDRVHVIATTRCERGSMGGAAVPVSLGSLFPLDALRLLNMLHPFAETEKKSALAIVKYLGGHALSLQLAGAFLHENSDVSYADFAEGLESMGTLDVLEQARESVSGRIDYADIRRMQVEQLVLPTVDSCAPEELRALELASLLAPEGIAGRWIQAALMRLFPESMRKKGLRDPWTAIVRKFTGLCLWQEQEAEGLFSMHRLVREVIRAKRRDAEDGPQAGDLRRLLHDIALDAAGAHVDGKASWPLRLFLALLPTLAEWLAAPTTPVEILALPEILIGKILRGAGRDAECAFLAEKALERIAALEPGPVKDDLTAAYRVCRGQTLLARGDVGEALADYGTALALLERSPDTETPAVLLQRIRCLDYAGEAELARGRPAEALARHGEALAIVDAALATNAGNTAQWKMERCYTLDHVAAASGALGGESGRANALARHRQALEIREALCREDAENRRLRRDLAISFDFVGDALTAAGLHEEAARRYAQALRVREDLCEKDPDSTVLRRDLTVSCNKVGDGFAGKGDKEQALVCFEKALSIRREMVEREPENALFLYDYSLSLIKVGEIRAAEERYGEALGCFRLALSVRKKLAAAYPGNTKYAYGTALAWEKCATTYNATGDPLKSRQAFSESAALVREILAGMPQDSSHRPGLEAALRELEESSQG
ncbi:MAG: tetratricopeptide repeat protein [Desulfovibrio sp.]|uniref:tetratricopeptide repeat protein n=1 Tax=Desulfovibrio sp. TaxID=885 RepID=UPI002587CD20|nr:tetratricopeptide repeat protein [Desulfovibrio sp.]MCD7984980.1 tetratricopeptide repeat protein [Desulfovibrio sp.]